MDAQILTIQARTRMSDVAFVQAGDFEISDGPAVDPWLIVNNPNVSLYCLDHERQRAIFVETPAELDLAAAPFFYQAQYESAQRLIAVSYDALHAVSEGIEFDQRRLVLIYSVGRCGSTLVSRAFIHAQGVASLSEPDVYSQILMLRERDGSNEPEIRALLRSCTKIFCAAATHGGASRLALKFRSFGIELADLFYREFPQARLVFLYRGAGAWARSVGRAFGFFKPEAQPYLPSIQETFASLIPMLAAFGDRHARTVTPAELLACMWASTMQGGMALRERAAPLFAACYEDVKSDPRSMLEALFAHCGVAAAADDRIDALLGQDAQAGTTISQETLALAADASEDGHVAEVCRLIPQFVPGLTAATILPGSFSSPISLGNVDPRAEAVPTISPRASARHPDHV